MYRIRRRSISPGPLLVMLAAGLGAGAPVLGTDAAGPPADPGRHPPRSMECPMHGMEGGPVGGHEGFTSGIQELGLTAAQQQEMQRIGEKYRARGMDLRQRAGSARELFMSVSPDDAGYAEATENASATAAVLATDTVTLLSEMRAEFYGLLTDEQRQRLAERASQQRKKWDDWRSRHTPPK